MNIIQTAPSAEIHFILTLGILVQGRKFDMTKIVFVFFVGLDPISLRGFLLWACFLCAPIFFQ